MQRDAAECLIWIKMVSLFGFGRAKRERIAQNAFVTALEEHTDRFRAVVADSGSPSGLLWRTVSAADAPVFAHDEAGNLVALVLIEVEFDAAEDGEMDDAPGLAMVRSGTAVFRWTGRAWSPDPKAVFNFTPQEIVSRTLGWDVVPSQ